VVVLLVDVGGWVVVLVVVGGSLNLPTKIVTGSPLGNLAPA
jgi:hypothetical protein